MCPFPFRVGPGDQDSLHDLPQPKGHQTNDDNPQEDHPARVFSELTQRARLIGFCAPSAHSDADRNGADQDMEQPVDSEPRALQNTKRRAFGYRTSSSFRG